MCKKGTSTVCVNKVQVCVKKDKKVQQRAFKLLGKQSGGTVNTKQIGYNNRPGERGYYSSLSKYSTLQHYNRIQQQAQREDIIVHSVNTVLCSAITGYNNRPGERLL